MKLPESCKDGSIAHCWNCEYHAGVLKTYCPKNGGDAEYEHKEKPKMRVIAFEEYLLEHE